MWFRHLWQAISGAVWSKFVINSLKFHALSSKSFGSALAMDVVPFLSELPEGFIPATRVLNSISLVGLEELVVIVDWVWFWLSGYLTDYLHQATQICEFLLERRGSIDPIQLMKHMARSNNSHDLEQFDEKNRSQNAVQAINVLSFIFRDSIRTKCESEEFGRSLLSASYLSENSCEILKRVWTKYSASNNSSAKVDINLVMIDEFCS